MATSCPQERAQDAQDAGSQPTAATNLTLPSRAATDSLMSALRPHGREPPSTRDVDCRGTDCAGHERWLQSLRMSTPSTPGLPATPPPAGWYNDPQSPKLTRYWDGVVWTPMVRTQGQMRWRVVGRIAKWALIAFVAMFVLAVIVAQL